MKKTYKIEVDCAACAAKMEEAAKKTAGVKDATVAFMPQKMKVEFDEGATVGDSKEQVAVGDAVVLSHPHSDAVASWVDHGLEVSGGVDPVVDGTPGGVGF